MPNSFVPELDAPFLFRSRPESIPGDFRPVWRIGLLLLILHVASRGSRSSFGRLHVMNWGIRSRHNHKVLQDMLAGRLRPDTVLVRIEPSLNRAVDLAHGEGLIERVAGDRVRLTTRGEAEADKLLEQKDVYVVEKDFLNALGKHITEAFVDALYSREQGHP